MKKKMLSLLVAAVITLSFTAGAFAEEGGQRTYTLSLEKAIEMATKDNPQFISADTKIADAERQLTQAYKDQRDMEGEAVRLPSGISSAAVQRGYYVEQAKIGVESAKLEKTQAESALAYNVTQKYYSVKLAEALAESANNAYNLALNNKNTMDTQLSLGLVSQLDVNNASYSLNQAKAARDSYQRNLELAKKNLCISLQIDDENCNLVLTDGIEFEEFSTNLDEDISAAMDSRYDIYSLKSVYEQAERYTRIAALLGYTSAQYSSANQAMIQSQYTYTNTKKLIGLSINSCYNDILSAKDSLMLAEEKKSLSEQEYNVSKLQHDLGMVTNTQLTAAMNGVLQADIELENAKLTYKLAVKKYGYEIAIGLGLN